MTARLANKLNWIRRAVAARRHAAVPIDVSEAGRQACKRNVGKTTGCGGGISGMLLIGHCVQINSWLVSRCEASFTITL